MHRPAVLLMMLSFFVVSNSALAKDIPVQGRLFAGSVGVNPDNVNETLDTQGLKKFESVTGVGIEVTYPLHTYLDVGARYTKRLANVEENPADSSTDYDAKIDQDSVMLMARVPFYKSDIVRLDAFAGVGGSNTTMKVKTSSQDGEFTKRASGDWFSSPIAAGGVSLAVGYKMVYVVFEGGFESNRVSGFNSSGTTSSSIDTLDLSGSYFSLGLMFDGVPGSIGK